MPYPAYGAPRPQPNNDYPSSSYPPNGPFNPSSVSSFNSTAKGQDDVRNISRTPSPTPSEAKALSDGFLTWKQISNWRFWIRREWLSATTSLYPRSIINALIAYYIVLTVILTLTTLISVYHHQIVVWLTPVTQWMHK